MKRLALAAAVAAALFPGCTCAAADNEITVAKTPVVKPSVVTTEPTLPAACRNFQDFLLSDCELSWYGVRFYGTIDVGYGYQTHGAPWDPNYVSGSSYFLLKMNRSRMWTLAPNGSNVSNVGVQILELIVPGWSFVGRLEGGFDPFSVRFANSPGSEFNNIGVPVNQQTANADGSRAGQFYNGQGFFGVSSDTYGTLTMFRQNALMLDGIPAYDPMAGASAFSPLGRQGRFAGNGASGNARYSTSVKYRVSRGDFRAAALWQFGGYGLNNAARGAWEAQFGGDIRNLGPGTLSLDAFFNYSKDAVVLALVGAPTNAEGMPIGTMLPQTLTATLSNNTALMAVARYTIDKLKLYGGYEWIQFAPPSHPFTVAGTGFADLAGDFICFNCNTATGGTNINSTAFSASAGFKNKILQTMWIGARYSLTESVDVVGAYYYNTQNNFAASATNIAACTVASTNRSFCAGSTAAASALVDWKFAAKWDTYIGTMFSQVKGGMANGFLTRNNLATTAGLRFRF